MEDVIKELRIVNQRLLNLEFQVKEGDEDRKDLRKSFESFLGEFQEHKLEITGHSNNKFEDDSFEGSSQQSTSRDITLNDLNSEKSGESKLKICSLLSLNDNEDQDRVKPLFVVLKIVFLCTFLISKIFKSS